jgi:hypothetical protein
MNWEAIGAVGEILGALGVVVTLVYLARQIRQNTRVSRADMTKDLYLASRSAILDLTSNDRLAEIWADIRDFENAEEARRYTFYQSFFRLYELQFNLATQGFLDDSIARSYMLVIRMFAGTKYFDQYWQVAQNEFHDAFVEYVNQQIAVARNAAQQGVAADRLPRS